MKLAAIALLCVVAFGSAQAVGSRRALAEGLPEVQLYAQCGGKGVACNTTGGVGQCKDNAWDTVRCPKNSECGRESDHYWMCKPTAAPVANTQNTGAPDKMDKAVQGDDGIWTIPAWGQCGGSEGDCTKYGSKEDSCIDCPFPQSRCQDGYVCYRVVEYFWQCGPQEQYGDSALTCEGRDLVSAAAPAPGPSASSGAAAAPRTCEAAQEGYAVQGKRFKAVTMATADSNYDDCCASCTSEASCVAFHLNKKDDAETVCALFSEFTDIVAIDRAVAGLMSGAATAIAG